MNNLVIYIWVKWQTNSITLDSLTVPGCQRSGAVLPLLWLAARGNYLQIHAISSIIYRERTTAAGSPSGLQEVA